MQLIYNLLCDSLQLFDYGFELGLLSTAVLFDMKIDMFLEAKG